MMFKYMVDTELEAKLPFRVLAEEAGSYPAPKFAETTFADWWENGLSMESRAAAISIEAPETFVMAVPVKDGEPEMMVCSLTDGEPVEVESAEAQTELASDIPPVTETEEAVGTATDETVTE